MTNGDYDDDDMMMYLNIFLFAFLIALRPKRMDINKTYINLVVVSVCTSRFTVQV